jgi:hypothetical protein
LIFDGYLDQSDLLYHCNLEVQMQQDSHVIALEYAALLQASKAIPQPQENEKCEAAPKIIATVPRTANESAIVKRTQQDENEKILPVRLLALVSVGDLQQEHVSSAHTAHSTLCKLHKVNPDLLKQVPPCDSCLKWAQKSKPKTARKPKKDGGTVVTVKRPLQVIHLDTGMMPIPTWNGEHYFTVIVDVLSRKVWVQLLRLKSAALPAFITLLKYLRSIKPHLRLCELRADLEHHHSGWQAAAAEWGFEIKSSSAYTEKAWLSERVIGILRPRTLATIDNAGASLKDWGYAMLHVTEVLNDQSSLILPGNATRNQIFEIEV